MLRHGAASSTPRPGPGNATRGTDALARAPLSSLRFGVSPTTAPPLPLVAKTARNPSRCTSHVKARAKPVTLLHDESWLLLRAKASSSVSRAKSGQSRAMSYLCCESGRNAMTEHQLRPWLSRMMARNCPTGGKVAENSEQRQSWPRSLAQTCKFGTSAPRLFARLNLRRRCRFALNPGTKAVGGQSAGVPGCVMTRASERRVGPSDTDGGGRRRAWTMRVCSTVLVLTPVAPYARMADCRCFLASRDYYSAFPSADGLRCGHSALRQRSRPQSFAPTIRGILRPYHRPARSTAAVSRASLLTAEMIGVGAGR